MEKIYVTETGTFNKYEQFESIGVVGVDRRAISALRFIAERKVIQIKKVTYDYTTEVTYKIKGTTSGFRISTHNLI